MVLLFLLSFFAGAYAYLDTMTVPSHMQAFDQNLYEDVLDEQLCHEQMTYLINNNTMLLLAFLDAGIRTPRGFLTGNFVDLGNYDQCLAINYDAPTSTIEGKYCAIRLPLSQDLDLSIAPEWPELPDLPWPEIPWPELNPETSRLGQDVFEKMAQHERIMRRTQAAFGAGAVNRVAEDNPLSIFTFRLAVCIPKTCTTQQAISELLFNTTEVGLQYDDRYCRLPNDKQWVAADYVAIAIFSFFGLLVIASTIYDLYYTKVLEEDPKRISKLYTSFSVYTNTRRLVTYTPVPGTIECLDGVRSFAMMWVIVGHTYVNQTHEVLANPMDVTNWIMSWQAIWITMGPITVDTFFMLSGLLLVYTTAGKLTQSKLLKNLHMLYLNRLLRMFPLLAAFVLIQASFLNRISDGPHWTLIESYTHRCRIYWWSTLLHIQNWVNPGQMCLGHSWYLAVDVQLYIISPLVLFWVLGKRKTVAWIALSVSLLLSLVGAAIYNWVMEFQAGPVIPSRDAESQSYYLTRYYVNTLCRSSPFFIGMIYGYIMHLNKHEKLRITKRHAATLWACAVVILAAVTYVTYPIMQLTWDNQTVDNILNTFMRPSWALAVGWIIFACHHGYGGPINWVLSLSCFKVLSRISYAMYIVHYPLIFMVNASKNAPGYFSATASLFKFLADFSLAAIVAFVLTLLVDSPCSTLIKLFMGGGQRKPRPAPSKELMEENKGTTDGFDNMAYVKDETKMSSL